MTTTNVPAPVMGDNGFITPEASAIIAGTKADINQAFDNALNMTDETPQGQLANSLAALAEYANSMFLWFTNQIDPAYASGRMQDALGRIYFLERKPSEPTFVIATVSGLTGTVLPAGSLASATDGNIYATTGAVTIPASGSATVGFRCVVNGPIPCPAGTLNRVFRSVAGWDSVTNLQDGVTGSDVEGRRDFEERRQETVANNAVGTIPAIRGSVFNVPGVISAYVTENDTGAALVVGGVTLAAHSIYVAAVGGDDLAVADAIWRKKSGGAAYNGNTTVTVTDTGNGYVLPYPTYQVTFQRPTNVPILFSVEIIDSPDVPSDAEDQIRAAIMDEFNGVSSGLREGIGATIFASRYYCPVGALGAWARLRLLRIGRTTVTSLTLSLNINEMPTIAANNIAVTLV